MWSEAEKQGKALQVVGAARSPREQGYAIIRDILLRLGGEAGDLSSTPQPCSGRCSSLQRFWGQLEYFDVKRDDG